MVADFTRTTLRTASPFGTLTLVLGTLFLVSTSYMTLKNLVSGGHTAGLMTGPPAVTLDSLKRLPAGERADELASAGKAFTNDPLDAAAVLDLSIFAAADGNTDSSERLRLIAGDMTPRDTRIQAEALTILLRRGDFDQAMQRLDGLIRARPPESNKFFDIVSGISANPDGLQAVARMLATNPPWRQSYFAFLLAKGQSAIASQVIDGLRGAGAPASNAELASVIQSYMKAGDIDKAYAIWLSNLSEDELSNVKLIYDGGFDKPIRNLGFDWTVKPAMGLTTRLFPRNTASMDQTLQFDFADFQGTFANLSQMLRLRPGRFRLSGEMRAESFQSPTSLVFRLYCLDGGRPQVLDATAPLPESSQWISFDKTFEVPESGCTTQLLQLESAHAVEKAQLTRGLIAIDAIAIDKIAVLAP